MLKKKDLPPWKDLRREVRRATVLLWPQMGSWLDLFLANPDAYDPIVKTILLDPQDSYFLLQEILWNCYNASNFKDAEKAKRTEASDFLTERHKAPRAIKKLRSLAKKFPNQTSWVVARANAICGTKFPQGHAKLSFVGSSSVPFSQIFDEFLAALDESFKRNDVPGVRCGSYLHRYKSGTLLYSKPLDLKKSQGDAALNGLLFSLAFHFRRATTTDLQGTPYNNGEPMPRTGKPCIQLIAQYASIVFPDEKRNITEESINGRLKHLEKAVVTLTSW